MWADAHTLVALSAGDFPPPPAERRLLALERTVGGFLTEERKVGRREK